ncbi:MAG TPA: hypothetical protein VGB03_06195 [Acidimicrobiales bacterium]|jgi:hypothetical protein
MAGNNHIRKAAYALFGVASVVISVLVIVTPGAALEQPPLTIRENESFTRQYLTIAGNNPANEAYDPPTCRLAPYCDVIRLTIHPPADPNTGYFVRVQVSWTTQVETEVPTQGEFTNNDLDLFIFNVPYDPDASEDEQQASRSATGAQPETAYVSPAGDYDIVVVNFVGVNENGYKLTLTYVTETEFTPFELLEDFRPPTDEAVIDTSGTPASVPQAPAAVEPEPMALASAPPTVFLGSGAFDDPFGLNTPIASVSAAARNLLAGPQNGPAPPPGPVSTSAILLWLVVVPTAALGAGGWFLARRRSSLFSG